MSVEGRRKLVRKYSYACLIYEHVRCGFIHTYSTTESAASGDALREIFESCSSKISYVNYLAAKGMRKIYFPLEWVSILAKNVAVDLDGECKRLNKRFGENLGVSIPGTWWIDGA
jgi:hypothetical protein